MPRGIPKQPPKHPRLPRFYGLTEEQKIYRRKLRRKYKRGDITLKQYLEAPSLEEVEDRRFKKAVNEQQCPYCREELTPQVADRHMLVCRRERVKALGWEFGHPSKCLSWGAKWEEDRRNGSPSRLREGPGARDGQGMDHAADLPVSDGGLLREDLGGDGERDDPEDSEGGDLDPSFCEPIREDCA